MCVVLERVLLNRFILSLVLLLVSNNLFAAIDLTSASSAWSEVLVGGNFDPGEDQQAAASVDLTGFGAVPLFYMKYDDGGTPGAANSSDDEVAFRFRADNAEKNGDFSGYIWIGLDIDSDTDIDAFMMLIGKNGAYSLDVYDSGAGLNTSPSNTDLTSGSQTSVTTGFALSHDLITNIDTGGNADVDGDSDPDYLISYKVNFDALAAALNAQTLTGTNPAEAISTISSNAGVTIETNFKLVVSSAQNDNVLNGDIGG